ncbi:MAG: zinc metallopeptidase [Oscillospiraceae bacterium]|nr:zinc metallopeptidase [Oscillospiraceae bacterium]MDY2510538.1 zinc metallopeptidase [Ruminococcus callidus]
MGYGLLIIGFVICAIASWNVNATFKRYQKIGNRRGITAAQVARQILDDNGLQFVAVERVSGSLTDHYDPRANVVRLSDSVYDSASVAAIGVAAHECGHAVQHATEYTPIKIRQAIIPITQFGSYAWYFVLVLGLILSLRPLVYAGIILFSLIVLFQFVTLPVEFNASSRALKTLDAYHILEQDELTSARKVLTAAAMTYVASLVSSILQLVRLLGLVGRRDD